MTMPRRSLVRPALVAGAAPSQRQRKKQKLREHLERELRALARWQPRLKRAFNVVQKCQRRVADLERKLARLED
jgi:hypothetical protein